MWVQPAFGVDPLHSRVQGLLLLDNIKGKSLPFCFLVEDLFVGTDDELHPLLSGLGGADLPVWDVGGDEAQQPLQEDVGAKVHVVLLRGQFRQVLLLQQNTGPQSINTSARLKAHLADVNELACS